MLFACIAVLTEYSFQVPQSGSGIFLAVLYFLGRLFQIDIGLLGEHGEAGHTTTLATPSKLDNTHTHAQSHTGNDYSTTPHRYSPATGALLASWISTFAIRLLERRRKQKQILHGGENVARPTTIVQHTE